MTQRSGCTSNGDYYTSSVGNTINSQSLNQNFATPRTTKNTRNINLGNLSMNASTTNTKLSRVQRKLEDI